MRSEPASDSYVGPRLAVANTLWPDFGSEDIDAALADYGCRKRKFGALLPEDIESLQTG